MRGTRQGKHEDRCSVRAFALACACAAVPIASAQIPPGLDKGHRILLERGFQIQAIAVDQPEVPNWSVFDAGGWTSVDFAQNYFGPSNYLGPSPGHHLWSAWYTDYSHTSF